MHEAERLAVGASLFVRVMQRGCDLRDDRDDVLERQLFVAFDEPREQRSQVDAVYVLHRKVRPPIIVADVVDLDDVVVMQYGRESRFVDKCLEAAGLARAIGA